ncbi:hypothetical protein ABZ354_15100 [Streptomyces sp. NPDC005925]|uniref:hypothetical protein n=1 Tax=Streptomyces sp. NPDC005925 TaxID=3157172 RepID=UPI0033D5A9C5
MRTIAVRRAALAASTAALALLVTACGGENGDDDAKDQGGSSAAPEKTAAKALTSAELEKAALVQADVTSGKVVAKVPAADDVAQSEVEASDAACTPLAYAQMTTYVGKPAATVKRGWTSAPKKPAKGADIEEAVLAGLDVSKLYVTLASYADGGAEQAMKDLNAAAEKCAGGFTYTAKGSDTKVVSVATTEAPKGGDEALAVTLNMEVDKGVKAPMKTVVVRRGATLAYFPVINMASAASGKDFAFPTEIVDVQLAKLG